MMVYVIYLGALPMTFLGVAMALELRLVHSNSASMVIPSKLGIPDEAFLTLCETVTKTRY